MIYIPSDFYLPFIKKEKVARDTFAFYFDRKNIDLKFIPGQYIKMRIPHENADERGTSRSFSIASSPLNKENIFIITKIIQSSFKKRLNNLSVGQKVEFFGPLGSFLFKEEDTTPRVFLAGGIGITPFLSMISYANEKKLQIPITLFVSFSAVEEFIYYDYLTNIVKNNPSIKIAYTASRIEESQIPWNGETGRISQDLIKKYIVNIGFQKYFIAGPPAMVSAMEELVKGLNIPAEQIKKENFIGY